MAKSFGGFAQEALAFFRQLEKHNDRDWFQPRKAKFEELLRKPMLELVGQINEDMRKFAVDHVREPEKTVFRIYRDTRFSKDKTPYKTHIAATFVRHGMAKLAGAGFYFGVSHTGVDIAGGMYMPGPPELAAVRKAIAEDEAGFRKMITSRRLNRLLGKMQGAQLTRVPRGYAAGHPAGDLLRHKQFYFLVTLPPETALQNSLRRTIVERFECVADFVHFLNASVLEEAGDEDTDAVAGRPEPMF